MKKPNFLQKKKKIIKNLENDSPSLSIAFFMPIFFQIWRNLSKFFFKKAKINYKTAKIDVAFSRISLIEIPAGIFPQP